MAREPPCAYSADAALCCAKLPKERLLKHRNIVTGLLLESHPRPTLYCVPFKCFNCHAVLALMSLTAYHSLCQTSRACSLLVYHHGLVLPAALRRLQALRRLRVLHRLQGRRSFAPLFAVLCFVNWLHLA